MEHPALIIWLWLVVAVVVEKVIQPDWVVAVALEGLERALLFQLAQELLTP
jgi:hypothetical protein